MHTCHVHVIYMSFACHLPMVYVMHPASHQRQCLRLGLLLWRLQALAPWTLRLIPGPGATFRTAEGRNPWRWWTSIQSPD